MAIVDGWLDWAAKIPGPVEKQYSQPNSAMGYVPHSAVGFYGGWESRLFDMSRDPDTGQFTKYAAASVHGWIAYDGAVTQHYPFTASCWASGNFHANTNFVAFENEGGYSPHNEPLTPQQESANVRVIQELSAWRGWTPSRPADANDKTATLYEHNECVTLWGGGSTSCWSHRGDWTAIMAAFQEEDDMFDGRLMRDPATGEIWAVLTFKGSGAPVFRRRYPHVPTQERIADKDTGPARNVGDPGEYTVNQFATIPILD